MSDAYSTNNKKLSNVKEQIAKVLKENNVSMSIEHNHWLGWCFVLEDEEIDNKIDKDIDETLWIKDFGQ